MPIIQQGMSQMTAAAKAIIQSAMGKQRSASAKGSRSRSASKAKTRKRKSTKTAKRASGSKTRSKAARLVKGSAAAKRYMAKIRKMRKK